MERLIVDIDSAVKARELRAILEELGFVRQVRHIQNADEGLGVVSDDSELYKTIQRRTNELESGDVQGLSLEELKAGVRASKSNGL